MFCPECGSKNLENANFCKECGFDFNHEIRTVEIQKPLKTQVNEIGIYTEDLDIPYQEISKIKAKVGAATAFSKSPTIEDINFKLQEEASKKGANAIIKVKYNRGISLTSWKSMSATGIAILMESDEKKCPFCAEMIKKEAIKCKHCGSDLKNYEL